MHKPAHSQSLIYVLSNHFSHDLRYVDANAEDPNQTAPQSKCSVFARGI